MKATLIYNPQAGGARQIELPELLDALEEGGLEVEHAPTERPEDLPGVLERANELLVVAGGDGTLRTVAKHVIGEERLLAYLPMGTANNIASSLGLEGGPVEVARALKSSRRQPFDVGWVESPWGPAFFLEALGVGFFAELLRRYDPDKGKSVRRALETLWNAADYEPLRYRIKVDGQEISGRYVAVEVLNTQATGPRLRLAPGARVDDGLLEVVCVLEPERLRLADHAIGALRGTLADLPNVQVLRGRRLELALQGTPVHLDAEIFPPEGSAYPDPAVVSVEARPAALEFLVPA